MSIKVIPAVLVLIAAAVAAVIAFGGDSSSEPDAAEAASQPAPVRSAGGEAAPSQARTAPAGTSGDDARDRRRGVVLRVRETPFGKVIHEKRSGLAAYLFTREKRGGKPRCYGGCADAWPPIRTKGRPIAGSGLDQDEIGTVRRRRGGRMVTYDGRPLYFYVADSPGTILCNDVFEFGGEWFVIGPDGEPASG